MTYTRSITVDLPYDEAVAQTRAALAEQGFGVLTEIDVRATLEAKLGVGMEPYIILGACNPQLAHQALDIERTVGVLLPCNVVVRERDGGSEIDIMDPQVIASLAGQEGLEPVAAEAGRRLDAVLAALRSA